MDKQLSERSSQAKGREAITSVGREIFAELWLIVIPTL